MKSLKAFFFLSMLCALSAVSACNKDGKTGTSVPNPTAFLTDSSKIKMLYSIKNVYGGELYELCYTEDYQFEHFLQSNVYDLFGLMKFVYGHLFDVSSSPLPLLSVPDFGCSMFVASQADSGEKLEGRNYDSELAEQSPAILVRTSPKGRKQSISVVDGAFFTLNNGFYGDGKSDISLLMAAPYVPVDGINEDGLAIGSMMLDGNPAFQQESGKKFLWSSALVRLVLDYAGTVKEAENLIRKYNISAKMNASIRNLHYIIADTTGDYAIIECSYRADQTIESDYPDVLYFFGDNDTLRYATNFYVDPRMANESIGGLSQHGRDRYNVLRDTLTVKSYHLTELEAKNLLSAVKQTHDTGKSITQWSSLYNIDRRALELAIHQKYDKWFDFSAIE